MRLHRKPPFVPFCAPQRLPVRLRVPTGHLAPAPRWPKDPPTPQLRHSPTVAVPLPLLPQPTYHLARKPPARPSNPQPLRRHATKVPSRRALARRRLLLPRQPPPRLRLRGRPSNTSTRQRSDATRVGPKAPRASTPTLPPPTSPLSTVPSAKHTNTRPPATPTLRSTPTTTQVPRLQRRDPALANSFRRSSPARPPSPS